MYRVFVIQCAWCGAVHLGPLWALRGLPLLQRYTSHGICPRCKEETIAAIQASKAT